MHSVILPIFWDLWYEYAETQGMAIAMNILEGIIWTMKRESIYLKKV